MRYNVDTLTLEDLQRLIALGDDSHANQIRINYAREIYLSPLVGAQQLDGICGRFETFDAGNGYVGLEAAANMKYINRLYRAIQRWREHPRSYVDIW